MLQLSGQPVTPLLSWSPENPADSSQLSLWFPPGDYACLYPAPGSCLTFNICLAEVVAVMVFAWAKAKLGLLSQSDSLEKADFS